jgi:hypothetical protein
LNRENLISESWKLYPHTLGYYLSAHSWYPYNWLTYVSKLITYAILDGNARIILNAPARHGKSLLLSRYVPIWFLEHFPNKNIILSSYGHELAASFGREVRNNFDNPMLHTKLRQDSHAAHRFNTKEGGAMLCTGVGGPITGFGGQLILIDDVVKNWAEGQDNNKQLQTFEWYQNTLRSRLEPGGSIIILMTRWNPDDLTGMILKEYDNWTHISLPAIALDNDVLGRKPGQALCPERYDEATLDVWKSEMSNLVWEANYQQQPLEDSILRAFPDWSESLINKNLTYNSELELDASFDFNISPGMHIIVGQHTDTEDFALNEIYEDRLSLPSSLVKLINYAQMVGAKHINIFGDSTGKAQSVQTAQSDYDLIRQYLTNSGISFNIMVPKAQPPQKSSMAVTNFLMRKARLQVSPLCKKLIRDFKYLKLDENGKISKSDNALSHASDCVRYKHSFLFSSCLKPELPKKLSKIGVNWNAH